MTVNWFSPVPPAKSSIALDAAAVLPALARRAHVVLWTHEAGWSRELEQHADVRLYNPETMPWDDIDLADATFYHIGNHAGYHGPIWKVNQQHPGIVVLHDLSLQHLFAGLLVASPSPNKSEYVELMEFHHSSNGRQAAEAFLAGTLRVDELSAEYPLTGAAIEHALGVAVHTKIGQAQLASSADLPVAYVPLFAPQDAPRFQPAPASREPRNGHAYRIVMFGFLGFNRRIEPLLQALHQLPARERFHLHVYGTLPDKKAVLQTVDLLGLRSLVTVHGFVPETELNGALADADLAINLRDPSMGEASSTQLRIWHHGLPSLVTDTGWYATLPADTVAKVHRETEVEDIIAHLEAFLAKPERYRQIGKNGRRHVDEHHTIEAYLDGLMELVDATRAYRPRESARWVAGRAGQAMRAWFTADGAEILLPRVECAIRDLCRAGDE